MMENRASALESMPPAPPLDAFPIALLELRDSGEIARFNSTWVELMERPQGTRTIIDYVHQEDRPL